MRQAIIIVFILLSGCGGGGGGPGGGAGSATTAVTLYHPSGRLAATGHYLAGTTTRTGAWREHFDAEGSPLRWSGTYASGAVDASRPWQEWNLDGSLRVDSTDH